MEKNRRELSRSTVLARPSNGLAPTQRDVSIRQSPNRSGRGIRISTPNRSLVLPPRRKGRQSQPEPIQEEYVEQYPEGYEPEAYMTEDGEVVYR